MRSLTPTRVHRRTAESGFSLIVMSILITAAAIVMVSMLPGDGAGDYNQKTISNVTKLERVEEAMRSFMAFNGRRPCPAQGSYPLNSKYFGQEAGTPGTCTGNVAPTPNAPMGPDSGTGRIVAGMIPVRTLALPEDYAFDAYGRRFTYTVDTRATKQASCQSMYANKSTGDLVIEDGTHTVIDNVMYAYTSHGPSGYGAFPGPGSAVAGRINSGSTDADMQTNAGVDALGASSTFTYNTTNFTNIRIKKDRALPNLPTTTGFDDLVWYRDDLKNTCCLGQTCVPLGMRIDGTNPTGYSAQHIGLTHGSNQPGSGLLVADLNHDNKPDLVILGNDFHIYVVFGDTRANLTAESPLKLTSLNGTNGFDIRMGRDTMPASGASIIFASGDFNGDGNPDLAIATEACGASIGYVYIVFGHTGSWPASIDLSTFPVGTTAQNGSTPEVYKSVNNAFTNCTETPELAVGRIHNSSIDDLVIGDFEAPVGGLTAAGTVYVLFGSSTPGNIATNKPLSGGVNGNGFEVLGYKDRDGLGWSVAVGDFDGDGHSDIAIGAPGYGDGNTDPYDAGPYGGRNSNGYIIWGHDSTYNWPATITASASMAPGVGLEINNSSGGSPGQPTPNPPSSITTAGIWTSPGTYNPARGVWWDVKNFTGNFGWSIAIGHHKSGPDDVFFDSKTGACSGVIDGCGAVHAIFGSSTWPSLGNIDVSDTTSTFNGQKATLFEAAFEGGSSSMPVIVGLADTTDATGTNNTLFTGVADFATGNTDVYFAYFPTSPWPYPFRADSFTGSNGFAFTGLSTTDPGSYAALGDVDGDGISDYLITEPGATVASKANAGKVYILKGGVSWPANITPSTYQGYGAPSGYEIDGANAGDGTGGSVLTVDFDNDGHNDVVVGASNASPGGATGAGSVYVVWGKQAGWKTSIDLGTIGN